MSKGLSPIRKFKAKCKKKMQERYDNLKPSLNNDLTKICFNYACEDLDRIQNGCKREKVCDMQIRKSSLES